MNTWQSLPLPKKISKRKLSKATNLCSSISGQPGGPCRMVSPIVEQIAEERADIKVGKINVDEQTELATAFRVMSIPTLVAVKDGKIVNQSVGVQPKADILALLD